MLYNNSFSQFLTLLRFSSDLFLYLFVFQFSFTNLTNEMVPSYQNLGHIFETIFVRMLEKSTQIVEFAWIFAS